MYIGSGNLGSGSSNSGSKFGFGKLCSSVCAKGPTTVYSLQVCLTAPGGGCSSWFGDSHSKNWKPATKPLTRLSWNSCCLKHCHQLEMHRLRHHHQHSSSKTSGWKVSGTITVPVHYYPCQKILLPVNAPGSPRPILTSGQITLPNSCSDEALAVADYSDTWKLYFYLLFFDKPV